MKDIIHAALPDNPVNLAFLLLFVAIFAGVFIYHFRPSMRAEQERESQMPFND
jgi:cbb3-type cytochrome oxidase subunit 3